MEAVVTCGISGLGTPGLSVSTTRTFTGGLTYDFAVAGTTANQLLTTAWTAADADAIFISSDITLTIKTNSSGSPAETITITEDVPFFWQRDSGITNPFATNVTALYISPAGAVAGTLKIRVVT